MADALTFGTVVALTLSSSVLAAGLTQGITAWRERGNRRREVGYLALRLATKFERYAQDAASFVGGVNDFYAMPSEGVSMDLPVLSELPSEQERWRDLYVVLTAEVLSFDEDRRSQQNRINDTSREDMESAIDISKSAAILLGIRALSASAMLRKLHNLPPFDTDNHWLEFLIDEYDQLPDHTKTRWTLPGPPPKPWWKRGPFLMLPQRSFDV